jgi:hypothetical protein
MTRRTPREVGPEPHPVPPDPWSERDGLWTVGDPAASAVAVVCCLHGDEPCGKRAVERWSPNTAIPRG